jgi:hypothetical protein
MKPNTVTVYRTCPLSGKVNSMTLNISAEDYNAGMRKWKEQGALIQNALPMLSPDEREFLISGILPADWDALFDTSEDN